MDSKPLILLRQLLRGGATESEAMYVIRELHAKGNGGFPLDPDSERELLLKAKETKRSEIDVTGTVREFVTVTDRYFTVTDAVQVVMERYASLHKLQSLQKLQVQGAVRAALKRMKDAGEVVPGKRHGEYRKILNQPDEIDILSGKDEMLQVKWPFGIESYVGVQERNIVIVGGSQNSGKTAFLLNFTAMNMKDFRINYFSSEMSASEFKVRLSKFNVPLQDFKKHVKWYDQAEHFEDTLKPDDINVIDYLEVLVDFFEVGKKIFDMYKRLGKGLLVVGIQKPHGRDMPRGGDFANEKSRLTLAIDDGRIKIVKGKAWMQEGVNPNGLIHNFKLVQGCHFINANNKGWHKPDKEPF